MKIVILSGTCSKEKYKKIFEERTRRFIDPSQKFFYLLVRGMSKKNSEITCISMFPVSGNSHSKRIWRTFKEKVEDVSFIYPGFINKGILRLISGLFTMLIQTFNEIKRFNRQEQVILYDPTSLNNSIVALLIKKIMKIKIVALITDIPSLATVIGHRKQNFIKKNLQKTYDFFADYLLGKADGYIFLTEAMNELVNKNKKPYIIIEGSVDSEISISKIKNIKKDIPKSIVYAGGIHEKFGIIKLAKAFMKIKLEGYELHIYGAGQGVETIRGFEKNCKNIKYKGVLPVEQIVEKEMKATLLVNPRPVNEEFVKYSFPSKTLEYMVSGTPVLTTKLAGIPKEYFNYVYTFEKDTIDGIVDTLNNVLRLKEEKLTYKGSEAKEYVLKNKNNIIQGQRIIDFLKEV